MTSRLAQATPAYSQNYGSNRSYDFATAVITGTTGADNLRGTLGNDQIDALGGNDTVRVSQGADTLQGGSGNDRLRVDVFDASLMALPNAARTYTVTADRITDSSGVLNTTFGNFEAISIFASVEAAAFFGVTAHSFSDTIDLRGFAPATPGSFFNTIELGNGNNTVFGAANGDNLSVGVGINHFDGGLGNDTFAFSYQGRGDRALLSLETVNAVTTAYQNGIAGNSARNIEFFRINPSTVAGEGTYLNASQSSVPIIFIDSVYDDLAVGTPGNDIFGTSGLRIDGLRASGGVDFLTGGGGADLFEWQAVIEGLDGTTITDFGLDDTIDLSFNSATFQSWPLTNFVGTSAFTGVAGQVRYLTVGDRTFVEVDVNGDRHADHVLTLLGGAYTIVARDVDADGVSGVFQLRATAIAPGLNPLNGTNGDDVIVGSDSADRVNAGAGDDVVIAGNGDDLLVGGDGNDQLNGGSGFDTADYSAQSGSVTINLTTGSASGPGIGSDSLISIERAVGGSGNDTLVARGQLNTTLTVSDIVKPAGTLNDSIARAVSLEGAFDVVQSANITSATTIPHATIIATGAGHFEYYRFDAAVGSLAVFDIDGASFDAILELLDANGTVLATNDDGELDAGSSSTLDSFLSVEFLVAGTYVLRVGGFSSTSAAPVPVAAGSSYTLHVSLSNTQFTDQAMGSELAGGLGADALIGGVGKDTASYADDFGAIFVNLSTGLGSGNSASGDTYFSIENVIGTAFSDTIIGESGANRLVGGGGDDVLIGSLGGDELIGGGGIDTASYEDNWGGVFVNLDTGLGFGNAAQGDDFESIENLKGSIFADFFIGTAGDNRLDGGAGDDTLIGSLGADILVGGSGRDIASYEDNSGAVFVNLTTGVGNNNAAQGDVYSGVEDLKGGLFDDFFIGDAADNRLTGAMGADTLLGAGGADIFVFDYAPGATSIYGRANVDTILDFTSSQDKIELAAGVFTGIGLGTLAAGAFALGTTAQESDDRILYDQASGQLFYDADGAGGSAAVLFAVLDTRPVIQAADFVLV